MNERTSNAYSLIWDHSTEQPWIIVPSNEAVIDRISGDTPITLTDDITITAKLDPIFMDVEFPAIKNVIFNPPATIVFWDDGTKTVVKCSHEDFDPEKGLAMAISKKALGNKGHYFEEFKKWLPKEEVDPLVYFFHKLFEPYGDEDD